MFYDSWVLHNFIFCNLALLVIAIANYLYREVKGHKE